MPAARAGGIAGPYLSSFLQSYLAAQQIGQRRRESESQDILRALQAGEFLRQRGAEEEGQGVLGQILARQAARQIAPARPVSVSTAETPEAPGVFAESVGVPQPGGGMGGLMLPGQARPPVLQTLLEGIEPTMAARALSRPGFRESLKPLAEAEEERRRAEEREQAEEFLSAAKSELLSKNPVGYADNLAAAARRMGRGEEARFWMDRGFLLREKADRQAAAREYLNTLVPALEAWDRDQTLEHYEGLTKALGSAPLGVEKDIADTFVGLRIKEIFSDRTMPPPVQIVEAEFWRRFKAERDAGRTPDETQLWQQAYAKFPQFAGRHTVWWDTQKGGLPEGLRRFLRRPDTEAEKLLGGSASQSALGRMRLEFPQLQPGTAAYRGRYEDLRAEEIQKRQPPETPLARAQRERIEQQTDLLKSAGEADLTKLDERTLTLQAQRLTTMAANLEWDSPDSAASARRLAGEYVKELDRRRAKPKPTPKPTLGKVTFKGIQISPPPPEASLEEAKRLRAAGQAEQAQRIETRAAMAAMTEANRLRATGGLTDEEIVQAMKSAGWDVD